METNFEYRTHAMPDEMQVLFREYPRDQWDAHPGFKEKTRQWMRAHAGFRALASAIENDSARFLDRDIDPLVYRDRLADLGNLLTRNLHGHHSWEDRQYFPELSAADPRFDRGIEILEKDHEDLDQVLDAFAHSANRAIQLSQLDQTSMPDSVGAVNTLATTIGSLLDRHLADEEDLAVPIILHHRLRG